MGRTPRLLDLCCGAGGASDGYDRAGWDVVGVDIERQPNYLYEFHQGDALDVLRALNAPVGAWWSNSAQQHLFLRDFDAVHASFPCQSFTVLRNCRPGAAPRFGDLVTPGRVLLQALGLPYVIENVPGSPLVGAVQLCGTFFGLPVRRHRWFETGGGFRLAGTPCRHEDFTERRFKGGTTRPAGRTVCPIGEYRGGPLREQIGHMGHATGRYMTLHELAESIPPAYTEFVGRQLAAHVSAVQYGTMDT